MGIHNKSGDWFKICQKTREEDAKRVKAGELSRLQGDKFEDNNNIHTTPQAEKFLQQNRLKRDENGKHVASTERGKRRKAKKEGK